MRPAHAQLMQIFGRRELDIGGSLARCCKAPAFTRGCYCPYFWRWPITQTTKAASGCVLAVAATEIVYGRRDRAGFWLKYAGRNEWR